MYPVGASYASFTWNDVPSRAFILSHHSSRLRSSRDIPMMFCSSEADASMSEMPEAFSMLALMNIISIMVLSVSWITPRRLAV